MLTIEKHEWQLSGGKRLACPLLKDAYRRIGPREEDTEFVGSQKREQKLSAISS